MAGGAFFGEDGGALGRGPAARRQTLAVGLDADVPGGDVGLIQWLADIGPVGESRPGDDAERQPEGRQVDAKRPRNRDDCVVPGAGLRDDIIAGPIIVPIYVYLPLKHETFLDLGVIMLGAGSTRFHAERSSTLAGWR